MSGRSMRYTFPRQSSKLSTSKREARSCYASPEPLLYWRASRIPFSWLLLQKSSRRSTRKRSRRPVSGSRRGPLRILLDTSFLLPTLGIDTGREVARGLKRLSETDNQLHYSSFSIHGSLRFLTVDNTLRGFITSKGLENTLIHVDQIPPS